MAVDPALTRILASFQDVRVLVIGEAILDTYSGGSARRLCREAPVPVVSVEERQDAPGGAANTAVNVRTLGGDVVFLSVIGGDGEGQILTQALASQGVSPANVLVQPGRRTLHKHRICAGSQMLLRVDSGDTAPVDREREDEVIEQLEELAPRRQAIVVSDYGYGVLTPRVTSALARIQASSPRLLIVDSRDLAGYRDAGATVVKPNYEEALRLLGLPEAPSAADKAEWMTPHGERVLKATGAQIAAVTLDSEGALIFERGRPPYRTYAQPSPSSSPAGAGDTFVAVMALALASRAPTPAAAELASAAASIVVSKDGTATCSGLELLAQVAGREKWVDDLERLKIGLAYERQRGRRIVFTNGCFDILHSGHIAYLNRAKSLGDVLVVAINSDASVRRLKGPARPINRLEDRIKVLAALSAIDYIVAFNEDNPSRLIQEVRPDIFVKGGDYTREMLPEAALVEALGGKVHILPYVEDRSTSGIIERIRAAELAAPGGSETR